MLTLNSDFFNFKNSRSEKRECEKIFRVTVVAFEDKCNLNCGYCFAELLKKKHRFEVNYFNEPFSKSFLNLQSRNFFDFIDKGSKILELTQSDILIWGYEEEGKVRLNFQIKNSYNIDNQISFSLLESLFVPLSYFTSPEKFSPSLFTLITGIIIAAIEPITNEQKKFKPIYLQEIIDTLAADKSPKDLSKELMPYIMNMIGKIYLANASEKLNKNDVEIIANLFNLALNSKQFMRLPIYYGCIYRNLGQLYESAYQHSKDKIFDNVKEAISNYKEAQKYLNRNYPYDFGNISYRLALLYFEFWKNTGDIQALRDAVSHLREAEKVYSLAQFPSSWCHIEGILGYYLTSLGMDTKSNEIMQLAILAYKNQQNIFEPEKYPCEWAEIQEKIGYIYYILGKQNDDANFMAEARNYYNSALEIHEQFRNKENVARIKKLLLKVKNYIA